MKKLFILVLAMFIINVGLSAGTIKVISPNGGETWVIGSTQQIKWDSSGLQNKVKLTLWQNNSLKGLIVKNMSKSGTYSWKTGAFAGGNASTGSGYKIKIREQGGSKFLTEDTSDAFFTISDSPDPNPNGIVRLKDMPTINRTIMVAPQFQPKKNILEFKKEVKVDTYGKLTPKSTLIDFGSSVNINVFFKNALKVKIWNKTTNKQIYSTSSQKPETRTTNILVKLNSIETKFEMEVQGSNSSYIANCWVVTRPVINEFRMSRTPRYEYKVHYSFSGCEYAYLKKFDTTKNMWIRVFKLSGGGYTRVGQNPKKGSIILVPASNKRTRYALYLIGELKQGVVRSKELVKNFWTDQYTK